MTPATNMLVGLSVLIATISPIAAKPSSMLSAMGWFPNHPRDGTQGQAGSKLAVIRAFRGTEWNTKESPTATVSQLELEVVLHQWKTRSADKGLVSYERCDVFDAWDGVDVTSHLLDPKYKPQLGPVPHDISCLGNFNDTDFDAADVVGEQTMDILGS